MTFKSININVRSRIEKKFSRMWMSKLYEEKKTFVTYWIKSREHLNRCGRMVRSTRIQLFLIWIYRQKSNVHHLNTINVIYTAPSLREAQHDFIIYNILLCNGIMWCVMSDVILIQKTTFAKLFMAWNQIIIIVCVCAFDSY